MAYCPFVCYSFVRGHRYFHNRTLALLSLCTHIMVTNDLCCFANYLVLFEFVSIKLSFSFKSPQSQIAFLVHLCIVYLLKARSV